MISFFLLAPNMHLPSSLYYSTSLLLFCYLFLHLIYSQTDYHRCICSGGSRKVTGLCLCFWSSCAAGKVLPVFNVILTQAAHSLWWSWWRHQPGPKGLGH